MTIYKLTDQDYQTKGGMQWGENVTHRATGEKGQELCSSGYIHAYTDPNLAVLFNPIHACVKKPVLWKACGKIYKTDGLKIGCRQLTTLKIIPLPKWETNQRVAFAILCALGVYDDIEFRAWALKWLSGENRSQSAAEAAGGAAWAAAGAAGAARAARVAARAAAGAAGAAAEAAAWVATEATGAAGGAARDAARAAAGDETDFIALAKKAKAIK